MLMLLDICLLPRYCILTQMPSYLFSTYKLAFDDVVMRTVPPKLAIYFSIFAYESNKCGRDQESIQLSTTPDPGYHMGK